MAPNQSATRDVRGSNALSSNRREGSANGRASVLFQKSWAHKLIPIALALAAIVAIGITTKVVWDLNLKGQAYRGISASKSVEPGTNTEHIVAAPIVNGIGVYQKALGSFRRGLYLIMATIAISFISILALFISKFVVPLNTISNVVRTMADGDLTISAPEKLPDDMRSLGKGLNDLAANFQEVLLFTGTMCGNLKSELAALEADLSSENSTLDPEQIKAEIAGLRSEIEILSEMVEQFKYYQVEFDGSEVKPK